MHARVGLSGGRSCRSRDIKIILIAALIAAQIVGLLHYLLRGPGANHIRVHTRSWISCSIALIISEVRHCIARGFGDTTPPVWHTYTRGFVTC